MKEVVTAAEMKKIDRYTIEEIGIPSLVLMERAALSIVYLMKKKLTKSDRILCVCGAGNNGGDGVAAARILFSQGYHAAFYMAGIQEKWTEETKKQIQVARNVGVPEYNELDLTHIRVVVDGLFGIGLASDVRKPYDKMIERINEWRSQKEDRQIWAVDIPSGLSADSGQVMGCSVQADYTVTFGFKKRGLILYPGRGFSGRCFVEDIGFPVKALKDNPPLGFTYNVQDFEQLPFRKSDSNKGSYGKILIIGGSKNMSGASFFAGQAACFTGAGLVRILTEEANRLILQTQLPQAMISVWEEMDDIKLDELLEWADSLVIGPGIGTGKDMSVRVENILKKIQCPVVLDADGLNLLSEHPEWYRYLPEGAILTPHMGEMARLSGENISVLKADRGAWAQKFALEHRIICVLKDSSTVVSDGEKVFFNESGNHGMATGGSGDILAGIIGTLSGEGMAPFDAACMGVWLHGCAGDESAEKNSARGMTALEVLEGIRRVFKTIELKNRGCDESEGK